MSDGSNPRTSFQGPAQGGRAGTPGQGRAQHRATGLTTGATAPMWRDATTSRSRCLSAGEIARELGQGKIDLGHHRRGFAARGFCRHGRAHRDRRQTRLRPRRCGGGRCPDCWLDVDTMGDLDDVAADFRQRHGAPVADRHQVLAPDTEISSPPSTASRSIASSKASAPRKVRRPQALPM